MAYSLIDTENQASSLNKRKGIIDSLEKCIRKTFYKDEEDATQYYMERVIRKRTWAENIISWHWMENMII